LLDAANNKKNDKGEVAYQPRAKEEIDRIAALVRSAIGFDAKRGDQIEVVNLRFAETAAVPISEPNSGWMSYLQFTKDDIMRFAEQGVMVLLGLVVLLLVVRPLVRRVVTPEGAMAGGATAVAGAAGRAGVAGAIGVQYVAAGSPGAAGLSIPGGSPPAPSTATIAAMAGAQEAVAVSNRTSAMIDVAQVQGQVHAQSVEKVGELAEKNPTSAVSIIRNWIHEDAA
jgi:flagellar M-ring protein FliF